MPRGCCVTVGVKFLPTPSARRATKVNGVALAIAQFLPTPSSRRATAHTVGQPKSSEFLPTPSARRATNDGRQQRHHRRISTHALREEGDAPAAGVAALIVISTHALREEGDLYQYPTPDLTDISTHALREEGDPAGSSRSSHKARFLPTPSARRATRRVPAGPATRPDFYPRPPRGGRRTFSTCLPLSL